MKKLFYLILFFVLAGCSSNEESKSMDTSATINSATNIESLGNNIEQNQSEKKSSILIQESDSEDIIRDDTSELTCFIPHPEMCNRNFVMAPLTEICPNWRHPVEEKSILTISKRKFFTDRLYKATNVL